MPANHRFGFLRRKPGEIAADVDDELRTHLELRTEALMASPWRFPFSVADYLALSTQQTTFKQVAAFAGRPMTYTDRGSSASVPVTR